MRLAWLAAVLEPRAVAPVPSASADELERETPGHLASVVLGWPWSDREAEEQSEATVGPVSLAARCLRSETIEGAVTDLADYVITGRINDPAQATALSLLVCAAASELDDFGVCQRVLDSQLERLPGETSDELLLRAVLLQQKALRLRDAGLNHLPMVERAIGEVRRLDTRECSPFEVRPEGGTWSATLTRIVDNLRASIASLAPRNHDIEVALFGQLELPLPIPDLINRTARQRSEVYGHFITALFREEFSNHKYIFSSHSQPDPFHAVLALELYGHASVYTARKELAVLRLLREIRDHAGLSDTLRLLRHANAKSELDGALRRMRYGGPLAVLSKDARQILTNRIASGRLRTFEMQVLTVAAELLAPPEARVALNAVKNTLSDRFERSTLVWEHSTSRLESAWVAAAALANACDASAEAARLLLDTVKVEQDPNDLFDRAMRSAVLEVDWGSVPEDLRREWLSHLDDNAILPATRDAIHRRTETPIITSESNDIESRAINLLNAALHGAYSLTASDIDLISGVVLRGLVAIEQDAERGIYSYGSRIDVADMAAALIAVGAGDSMWNPLTKFLLNSRVARLDRSDAFERLARAPLEVPVDVFRRFRAEASSLLRSPDLLGERMVTPYAPALRFLASHGIVDVAESFDAIAELAGAQKRESRREAARTVAVVAARKPVPVYLAFALALARDEDVEVRANAGAALAVLAGLEDALSHAAQRRLNELLREDGLLVPFRVLRALADLPGGLNPAVLSEVESIAAQHPSWRVRREATRILDSARQL